MSATVDTPALSRAEVDRAAHRRGDADWLERAWPSARVLVLHHDLTATLRGTHRPELSLVAGADAPSGQRVFLGEDADGAYFAVISDEEVDTGEGGESPGASLREVGSALDDRDAGLFVAAMAVARWHANHQFCPRCGARTEVIGAGWVRRCERDGSHHFPRMDPAMIVLVHDGGDRCLLGRQSSWPAGRFSTLAGFVEPGESVEMAVRREVAEESSVPVDDIRYVSSQPWPFPSSLMLGFTARATDLRDEAICVDGEEITDARWFDRDHVAAAIASSDSDDAGWSGEGGLLLPSPVSIAHRLVTGWVERRLP